MSKYARTITAVAGAFAMTLAGSAGVASAQSTSSIAGLNAGSAVTSTAEYGTISQYAVGHDASANLGLFGSLSMLLGSLGNITPGGGGGDDGVSDTVRGNASVTCDGVATVEYDNTASSASAHFQTIENTAVRDDRVVPAGEKVTVVIEDVFSVDVVYVNSKNQPVAVAFAIMPDECFEELDNPF